MNHQAIAHRGDADGVPPPSAGTLSIARLSQARNAIAVRRKTPDTVHPKAITMAAMVLNEREA